MDTSVGIMNGIGMINMRERAEMLGGVLHVDSAPGRGTDIVVEIPLP
jgi:signal transduction histidine kinase